VTYLGLQPQSGQHALDPVGPVRVAVAGLGAIGSRVVSALIAGIEGYELTAVAVREPATGPERLAALGAPPNLPVVALPELAEHADLIIECIPAAQYDSLLRPALEAGRTVITLTCSALLEHWDLVGLARRRGGHILIPSGAIGGLDAVQAAANGIVDSVLIRTIKPTEAVRGGPFLVEQRIDLDHLDGPSLVFAGTAREASKGFPANLNVVVAVALAGIGPDRTEIEMWVDPGGTTNRHEVEVAADVGSFRLVVDSVPSSNPRTGQLTALSVIALLKKLVGPLRIGT
jgi:aspartate dehydrogenase